LSLKRQIHGADVTIFSSTCPCSLSADYRNAQTKASTSRLSLVASAVHQDGTECGGGRPSAFGRRTRRITRHAARTVRSSIGSRWASAARCSRSGSNARPNVGGARQASKPTSSASTCRARAAASGRAADSEWASPAEAHFLSRGLPAHEPESFNCVAHGTCGPISGAASCVREQGRLVGARDRRVAAESDGSVRVVNRHGQSAREVRFTLRWSRASGRTYGRNGVSTTNMRTTGLTAKKLKEYARVGAEATLERLRAEIAAIERAFPDLRSPRAKVAVHRPDGAHGNRRRMSSAGRRAVSERMKRYWAARRRAQANTK
jgi:hypothetical protein